MATSTENQEQSLANRMRLIVHRTTFHARIYLYLRQEGYTVADAMSRACIECAECGGYADHWHLMTGTTADDEEQDLWDLVYGCTLHSDMPMACGHEANISLESGEWQPHCDECSNPSDDNGEDENEEPN